MRIRISALLLVIGMMMLPEAFAKSLEEILVEKGIISEEEARSGGYSSGQINGGRLYYDEGTRLEFPDSGFSVAVNTVLQNRYEYTDKDEDAGLENTSGFSIHRAKLAVSGHAINREFSYLIESSFQGQAGAFETQGRGTQLHDAYISWEPCDRSHLKLGQFKPKVVRQWNTHPGQLQFPDRSQVGTGFTVLRNQGAEAEWGWGEHVTVGGQIFNGVSQGEGQNNAGTDTDHLGGGYARVKLLGELDPYAEGDIDITAKPALDMGVGYLNGRQNNILGNSAILVETKLQDLSVDLNFKWLGWSAHGEFLWADLDGNQLNGGSTTQTGGYAQVGYFVQPKLFEIAGRYGLVDCDGGTSPLGGACSAAGVDAINETGISLNYYWWKHHLKSQLAYEFLNTDLQAGASGITDSDINQSRWIFQLSAWF